jgi:menaquinol-cytochrome c reductase iron-sulfur subunit
VATRRRVLELLAGGVMALLGAAVALPATLFVSSPLKRRKTEAENTEEPIEVAVLDRLPDGVPTRVEVVTKSERDAWSLVRDVRLGAAWLIRRGERVEALSTVCPHTGCAVDWEGQENKFICPCHHSVFDERGGYLSGPAPRGMDTLETRVEGKSVLVCYRRFRPGVSQKEPV